MDKDLENLQKKYGIEAIHTADQTPKMDVVSSGSYAIDFATGIGGFPRGYIVEIFAKEGVGKTSLSYYAIAAEQRRIARENDLKMCVFINLEGRFMAEWAQALGVDLEKLFVVNPKDGTDAANILYDLIKTGKVSLIVFDSVGAMLGKEEMDGVDRMGGQAKLVTGMVKRVMPTAWENRCTVIFLNQARADMSSPIAGAIESPGGLGLKHASALRIQLRRKEGYQGIVNGQKKEIGYRVAATFKKNKAGGSPKRVAEYDFYTDAIDGHNYGIDHVEEIMSLSLRPGVELIQRGGSIYRHRSFPWDEKTQENRLDKRENVVEYLHTNPEAVEQLRQDLIAKVRGEDG